MKKGITIFGLCVTFLFAAGCAREDENKAQLIAEVSFHRLSCPNSDITVALSPTEVIYWSKVNLKKMNGIPVPELPNTKYLTERYYNDSATLKRKYAIMLGRQFVFYKFLNYKPSTGSITEYYNTTMPADQFLLSIKLDGVSNILYNTAYIASMPHKLLRSAHISTSFSDWLVNILGILWGGLVALFMLEVGPMIGLICHPFETFANCTAGIFIPPPELISIFSKEYLAIWWDYFLNTNILASCWDWVWSATIYPLWEAIRFAFLSILHGVS